ncbi:MAG: gentisate 1,2-dioxygenase [Rhizobiaceae bacterium]|nr:gentisate 1,2-dioxygenase [Rhizobiaceae bacterium]
MNDFAEKIRTQHLSPLWNVMASLITPQPKSDCRAHLWKFDDIRPALMEAGEIISAKEAVRRVLILENPGMAGQSKITTSLYAGLQLVLPGEIAPAHRHSQSAVRFVLEGSGAHTTVDGERTMMEPGDFIITPPWAWHDHGNGSDKPMIWLDGLDIPIVQFFDASFVEDLGLDEQEIQRQPGTLNATYGEGLLPVDNRASGLTSPIFNYPYKKSRAALRALMDNGDIDEWNAFKMHYSNPLNGGYAMATMATFLSMIPKGFESRPYRSTDATVFVCVEGSGSTTINGEEFHWSPRDIFVVPSWSTVVHKANETSVLFSYSDRVVQEKLGIWRQEKM